MVYVINYKKKSTRKMAFIGDSIEKVFGSFILTVYEFSDIKCTQIQTLNLNN